jgi:hypothetical protein
MHGLQLDAHQFANALIGKENDKHLEHLDV